MERKNGDLPITDPLLREQIIISGMKKEVDNKPIAEEQLVPLANLTRLMRRNIPAYGKISTDAKDIMQTCVSEFISLVTSEANTRCQQYRRTTITAEDVLWAMSSLGFDDYIEPLAIYLNRYRETEGGGSLRGEPLVFRRSFVRGAMVIVGTTADGGFVKDASNAAECSGAVSSPHAYDKCN